MRKERRENLGEILFVIFFLILFAIQVEAAQEKTEEFDATGSILELYDFTTLDENLKEQTEEIKFSELVEKFTEGDVTENFEEIKELAVQTLFSELRYNKSALLKILFLAVIAAVFSNISVILEKTEILETGFFITYMLMITILISSFGMMAGMLADVVTKISEFIKILIPSMVLSVGLCAGQSSALGFGEIALFIIFIGESLLNKIVIPAIKLFVIIMLINNLMTEDYFSKFALLIQNFVCWFLKFFLGIVLGIDIVKGMILPGVDSAARNTAGKLINLIPGASGITSAGNILLSSATVIKNAVGGAAVIIIFLIVLVPVIKMLLFVIMYKFMAALIEPISDKRITRCVDAAADGVVLLSRVLMTQVLMLALSIAILCIATN